VQHIELHSSAALELVRVVKQHADVLIATQRCVKGNQQQLYDSSRSACFSTSAKLCVVSDSSHSKSITTYKHGTIQSTTESFAAVVITLVHSSLLKCCSSVLCNACTM
jgi:hypothetical protein